MPDEHRKVDLYRSGSRARLVGAGELCRKPKILSQPIDRPIERFGGRADKKRWYGRRLGQARDQAIEDGPVDAKATLEGVQIVSGRADVGSEIGQRLRTLAKDWECLNRKALAFLKLASIRLMLRKLCNPT
jgi:hypothetical protein